MIPSVIERNRRKRIERIQNVSINPKVRAELLDITRIDSGGVQPQPAPVRLNELFARLRLSFEPAAFEKGLALSFRGEQHVAQADPAAGPAAWAAAADIAGVPVGPDTVDVAFATQVPVAASRSSSRSLRWMPWAISVRGPSSPARS